MPCSRCYHRGQGDRYDRAVGQWESNSNASAAAYSLHLVNFIACQSFALAAWMGAGALLSAWGLLTSKRPSCGLTAYGLLTRASLRKKVGKVTSVISHSQGGYMRPPRRKGPTKN